ncbi:ERF family protein [Pasteurella multocida]|uniref:ERF family protein n=1 Tax=Pasteurella multocida TaxID=747 RepID=UPI002877B231|nr:ERF family protein [Pasteurella multocida]WND46635.1 ERF family protein [Pasteurella multocida]
MSIYHKLAQARVKLQDKGLEKTGTNSFIKVKVYKTTQDGRTYASDEPMPYFELGDFLPEVNKIFEELKMCSVVSFTDKLATLTIFDSESDGKIEFTSPMPTVPTLTKDGSPIPSNNLMQSIGALQTYQRRYLYMAALEIVECDAIDSQDFKKVEDSPKQRSQGGSKQPAQQNTSSGQVKKSFDEMINERLNQCKSKEELTNLYDPLVKWVGEKHPDKVDEFNIIYNDKVLSFM